MLKSIKGLVLIFFLVSPVTAFAQGKKNVEEDVQAWLKANIPMVAEELEQTKVENPKEYQEVIQNWAKDIPEYRELKRENPKLFKEHVKWEELEVRSYRLSDRIQETEDDKTKEELIAQLRQVLNQAFDAKVNTEKLELEDSGSDAQELGREILRFEKDKKRIVERRLEKLVNGKDAGDWE